MHTLLCVFAFSFSGAWGHDDGTSLLQMPNLDQMMLNAEMVMNDEEFEDVPFVQMDDEVDDMEIESSADDETAMLQMPNLAQMMNIAERSISSGDSSRETESTNLFDEEDGNNNNNAAPEEFEEASAMLQLPCHIRARAHDGHDDAGDELMSLMQLPHFKDLSKQPQFVEQLAKKRQIAAAEAAKYGFEIEVKDGEDLDSMFQRSRQEA